MERRFLAAFIFNFARKPSGKRIIILSEPRCTLVFIAYTSLWRHRDAFIVCHGAFMARIDPKFMLRLPEDLKERVQEASAQSNQSMNSLILSLLEREFPQPTINLNDLSAFLAGLTNELADGDETSAYIEEVNRALASTKYPWSIKCEDGVVSFYPCASPSA